MDFVSGLRAAIQDLLVPELKAIQVRLEHVEDRLQTLETRLAASQGESNQRFEALSREMNQRFEALVQRMSTMDGKLDVLMSLVGDLKETATLRARLEVVEREVAQLRSSR